ncbi:unknown [Choristoneura occidentalis granulovirus]|uniref:Uncharacterized protein n=1 Tax=Choristoneura occidentalis granulovirus TaxID=364745 RepID=Q1A4N8_9BBAC|nr:unknown [Choristoneura fumiferana granulovirus]ABC61192.1 unknown [Choristoneura fumiferana granulovirus]
MKRKLSFTENSQKLIKCEENDEDILISSRTSYIITKEKLRDNDVPMTVIVEDDNLFSASIYLKEGDRNLFENSKRDVLKFLLKDNLKIIKGEQYVVYVSI